jgi:NADH-quinone oxidoreductase subunit H
MGDPFGAIGQWLLDLLTGWGLSPMLAVTLLKFLGAAVMGLGVLLLTFLLIWVERKVLARLQDRLGPNRVGPWGIFQTFADALKLVVKEIITPRGVDVVVYYLAPLMAIMSVVGLWAVVPMAPRLIGSDINVGVLYIVGIGAVGTLAIMLAGWSSNNKYALLGAFRSVAQLVSYEVPMVLSLIIPTLLAGSMGMVEIVEQQRSMWFVGLAPLAALIFFVSSIAEAGKAPFDLLEAESEIVAGYNIEYSGLVFGMFYVAEFLHGFTISAFTAVLFLGGWLGPWADQFPLLGLIYFAIKTAAVYFCVIWIRGSLPRFRIDQVNALNWKLITPLALATVAAAAITEKVVPLVGWGRIPLHLAANGLIVVVTLMALGAYARVSRRKLEARLDAMHHRSPAASSASGAD